MSPAADTLRLLSIVGARPQFIKLAPVCRAIEDHVRSGAEPAIDHRIVHTGQHYDREMAGDVFVDLALPEPDCNLDVRSGSHAQQLARMLERLEPVIENVRPDWILVYGDTNSTLAGALLAARMSIPLAHIEAGCRSYNSAMPEEQNRVFADHMAQLLFVPTTGCAENLLREGIGGEKDPLGRRVVWSGDLMRDVLLDTLPRAQQGANALLASHGLSPKRYYLLTLHRAENTADVDRLARLLDFLETIDLPVLFPIHPRTRNLLPQWRLANQGNIRIIAPLGYVAMLAAEKNACRILTDSGGVQKEAFFVGVPCLTLREETEWPETVAAAANRLTGMDQQRILQALAAPDPPVNAAPSPFGDGNASQNIVRELIQTAGHRVSTCPADTDAASAQTLST